MAGSRPGESNGGATGSTLTVAGKFMPVPDYAISFFRDYDTKGVAAMMAKVSHCSLEVQMDTFSKGLEQFKKPNAIGAFPKAKAKDEEEEGEESDVEDVDDEVDEDEDDEVGEDEEDGEDEDEETLKLMVDDNKPATDGQLQVPNEGERECKKPRLAEGFGCQAEAAV